MIDPIPEFVDTTNQVTARAPAESSVLTRRFPARPESFSFEPSQRWVRGVVDGTAIVDSFSQFLIWEPRAKVPEYMYPREHVRTDLLVPSEPGPGPQRYFRPATRDVEWFDLVLGDRRIHQVAWRWLVPGLEDYLSVSWYYDVLDDWFEEDEPVHTHPRDPYNRVDAIPSSRHVTVTGPDGSVLAETTAPVLVYETGLPTRYYIPASDVHLDSLTPLAQWTSCPYKGFANDHWSLPGNEAPVAWSYSAPTPNLRSIAGYIAFYQDGTVISVDGETS
ncbi:MAG: DUF427 domain-containing protein [Micrococcaceae bacterium]|nr:DUF427 domain-containing protein [Micrococcaceae bacterium]